jgi:DedD protein
MDSRAKQRLTGAVILVALFVLLVPELLTGPKNPPSASVTAADDGLRRYTIDLDAPAGANGQAATPSVNMPPVAEVPPATSPELAVPGEAAATGTPEPSAQEPSSQVPSEPRAQPQPAPAATSGTPAVAATRPVTPAPRPAPQATSPAPVSAKPGTFVVQLGSFGSRENAERLVRDMTAKGFATFIAPITTNGRELYRVRVGPTRDRPSAEALAAQLKRIGQSGSIVPIS